jgi:hypothetical protein
MAGYSSWSHVLDISVSCGAFVNVSFVVAPWFYWSNSIQFIDGIGEIGPIWSLSLFLGIGSNQFEPEPLPEPIRFQAERFARCQLRYGWGRSSILRPCFQLKATIKCIYCWRVAWQLWVPSLSAMTSPVFRGTYILDCWNLIIYGNRQLFLRLKEVRSWEAVWWSSGAKQKIETICLQFDKLRCLIKRFPVPQWTLNSGDSVNKMLVNMFWVESLKTVRGVWYMGRFNRSRHGCDRGQWVNSEAPVQLEIEFGCWCGEPYRWC